MMVLAHFETPNFDFHALAGSDREARQLLREAWQVHAREYEADPDYFDRYVDDVRYAVIEPGEVLRDFGLIFSAAIPSR